MYETRIIATSLLFTFCVTIVFLCILALRKRASAGLSAIYLAMCGLCAAIYNFGYAMEINASTQAALFFWVRFQHIGIQFIVPFWLLFSLHITEKNRRISAWVVGLFFLIPTGAFFASQTLGGLNLIHQNARMASGEALSSFVYDRTWPLFSITLMQSAYLAVSLGLFINALVRGKPFPRIQAIIYVIGCTVPWISSLAYNFGFSPYNIDLSPFALGLSIALFVAGFLKIGILDISPLARDLIFEGMKDGVLVMDAQGRLTDMNRAVQSVFPGIDTKEPLAEAWIIKKSPPELLRILSCPHPAEMEYQPVSGPISPIFHVTSTPLEDKSGKVLGKLVNFHDVSDLKELQRNFEFLASHDVLTGLHNRRYLNEVLAKEIEKANKVRGVLSLFLLDLDHSKRVNDLYGHEAGDKILEAVGAICAHQAKGSYIVGRFGGEEILMILPGASLVEAFEVAERTRKSIEGLRLRYEGLDIRITASFGVAGLKPGCDTLKELLIAADRALYKAKDVGRNATILY
ncbi:MAG: diguanylate cyclase [Spirochaetales bacterium]|nr:diguanylate cyclase [Spirochaetales bacterium]